MITRVAVVPYPPLLVPELTVRTRAETERLRRACSHAAASLAGSALSWLAFGVDRGGTRRITPDASGTFAGYGVDVTVGLREESGGRSAVDPTLPLPVLMAGWLRSQVSAEQVTAHLFEAETTAETAYARGERLARAEQAPVGLLVLADGPRWPASCSEGDPADEIDKQLRRALTEVDTARLLGLDPDLCDRAGLEGRAALHALAGAADATGGSWNGELMYSEAPYGVSYHVAVWSRTDV